ncbi:copper amine oxidase N-terminal domain-containing protein [Saccharibacillus sp. CPCC 101409]|uniref:copper amine oxidase N-terminal domain-containing protein n=1 Tax=Saccharibacillus sp. CPCC 101409 TaxID=3058041 RepID=UPI0026735A82|nr:copper amine oxidase N-terminal domain-containing protein [Saccharibacillus sp. CPCC 101409]MDO3411382.1 copper amine oxidase N-terminal domain-containing protein [Saccharibacillus sp. CPCC 101409]
MKWKTFALTCFSFAAAASGVQTAAHAAEPVSIVVNDRTVVTDAPPFIQNGTTYVPLRSIEQIEGLSITSWNNKTKTLVVAGPGQSSTFRVSNPAAAGSPIIQNNRVMVPIRFIATNFSSDVIWNRYTQTVYVAKVDEKTKASLKSSNLTEARAAALNVPKISALKEFVSTESSAGSLQIYFPEGGSDSFFMIENGIIDYYEVKSNAALLVWSGKIGGQQNKLSFLADTGISSEVGRRPKVNERLFFYKISTHAGQSQYGYVDTDGKETVLGSRELNSLDDLYPIQEEN